MRTSFVPSRRLRKPQSQTHWVLGVAALTALAVAAPHVSRAADPAPSPAISDHDRIKQLEETVERLKKDTRQVEVSVENQNAKPLAGWSLKDGFTLQAPDGANKLRIGGYTQADGRFFIDDKNDVLNNQFLFRRARLDISGTVFKYFDFRILPDFVLASNGSFQLFDAFVDVNYIPEAKLRVGKFKPPVGLERLESATSLQFVERGQPTNLVPNRDQGVQLFGDLIGGAFSYQLAIVNGVPDNVNPTTVNDANDDKDFAGRVFAAPFKDSSIDPLKGLGFGVAGTYGRQRGSATSGASELPSFKSFGQATYFSYSGAVAPTSTASGKTQSFAFGQRQRIVPQLDYYWGPVGLLAEYARSAQAVRRDTLNSSNKVTSTASETLANDAWLVGASYVITGEAASYRGVVPAQPFDPFAGTWGAFEVAARYGQLEVDPDAFSKGYASPTSSARRDKEWVIGVNWYLNRSIKFVLDYGHSDYSGGAGSGKNVADRPSENAILSRVQLVL